MLYALLSGLSASLGPVADDLVDKVKNRQFYSGFMVKTALVKTSTGTAVSASAVVGSDSPLSPRQLHDYGPLVLEDQWYSKDEFLDWIRALSVDMKFRLSSGEDIPVTGSWQPQPEAYLPSNYQYLKVDWPSNFYKYSLQQATVTPPSNIFSPITLPLFPNGQEAVEWWFGVGDISRMDFYGKIVFLLPNFKARISGVEFGSRRIAVAIEKRERTVAPIVRIFSRDYKTGSRTLKDQELASDNTELTVEPDWTYLKVVLADKQTGELLDFMDIHTSWADLPKGAHREVGPEDLLELIRRGENEEVDFKESLTNSDDIVKTVVALANTRGGVLLIGVDDECQVVGAKDSLEVIEEKIRNWVRNRCEQTVQLQFQTRRVLDQDLVAVLVEQSTDKPCWMKEKGALIRYGSNNRLATRSEVATMFQKDSNPFSARLS